MFDTCNSLLGLAIISLTAFGLGRPVVRKLRIVEGDLLGTVVWSLSLGLLLAGSVLLLLAEANCVYDLAILGLSLAGSVWAAAELACLYLGYANGQLLKVDSRADAPEPTDEHPPALGAVVALGGCVLFTSLVVAMAPPTSPDALAHGLGFAKSVLWNHGMPATDASGALANVDPQAAPNLVRMWFLWALALDGPVCANLVHWLLGLLLALACVLLARPLVGLASAWVAGCLVLFSPGVSYQLSVPLEDLGLALYTTLAISAIWQIIGQLECGRWAIAAGATLGAAVAVQPYGVVFGIALILPWLHAWWRGGDVRRELLSAVNRMLPTTLAVAVPWALAASPSFDVGLQQTLPSFIAHVGPLAVAVLPAVLMVRRLRGLSLILSVLAAYVCLAMLIPLGARWWSPVVPLVSLAAAWVWQESVRLPRIARAVVSCSLASLVLVGPISLSERALATLAVASGWQTRDEFLLVREPSYRASAVFNRIARTGDRVFCQDTCSFYFAGVAAGNRLIASRLPQMPEPRAESDPLACARREGCSYVLLTEPLETPRFTPGSSPAAMPTADLAPDSSLVAQVIPILEYCSADDNKRLNRYRLLKLR